MTTRLDPLRLPLHGSRLIEASAGTGKTWTIAALYLRLVLGHGGADAGFARPLVPSEILVMTFTRAATRELSDRIRARLLQAARCFRGETEPDPGDSLLPALMAAHATGEARARAAFRLAAAAEAMDEAAVQTIDAWCQRMLREHAFDSGSLFDEELVADERTMVREAALDYWRQEMYPLEGEVLDLVLGIWPNAAALVADVQALLGRAEPDDADVPSLEALVGRLTEQRHALLAPHKANWRSRGAELSAWLDGVLGGPGCPFDKRKVHARFYGPWLDALTDWAHGDAPHGPELSDAARARLRPEGMRDAFRPGVSTELPAHFDHFEDLLAALDALPDLKAGVRLHAAACVARRVVALKARAGTFGFADLQERLAAALEGPNAERLRERIVRQYPVALVDEFQDTSPRQYRIFDGLYRPTDATRETALFLIGDPKQSIYGFRGADIHSYLRARHATEGRHHVLGVNHRSTEALVRAVNRLFGQAEQRAGAGAFLFREAGSDPLPFEAVAARGRKERFVRGAGPDATGAGARGVVPALTFCHDARLTDKAASQRIFAAHCAEEIATLLGDPNAGFAVEPTTGTAFERLRPADIAVLVRTGREAVAVRQELRRRGIASVYLSDQDSVFASAEARDMVLWLRAVADPADARFARAAFAAALTGLGVPELRTLATDELAWERRLEELRVLRGVWQRHGVLTMLRQLLHHLQLPARWLATPDGERRLTNVLHLAELLQAAASQHEGEQPLIRWFIDQVGGQGEASEERVVRLESDAGLVKVITVHKSKGLEFPLVFLPFAAAYRGVDKKRRFVEVVDAEGRRSLDFTMAPDVLARADRERLREDLRLLYVALTRARHALWVGVAALNKGNGPSCVLHASAIGQLLTGGVPAEAGQLVELLDVARGDCPDIALVATVETPAVTPYRSSVVREPLLPAPVHAGAFERDWSIGSFSTLVRDVASRTTAAAPVRRHDEPGEPVEPDAVRGVANAPWHRFPRGALPGNFLHEQLEGLAADGFDLESEPARDRLRRRCDQQGWGHRQDDVVAWLRAVSVAVLPPLGASLRQLGPALSEMEFWLPAERLAAHDVDAVCRRHLLVGRDRPALPPQQLRGLLMGFADLVFEHAGRYWVLDYKSNALGPVDAAYTSDALEAAIAGHRYDVQGALYLLALHRLLRARLGAGYRPAQHLGGAIFFFIRGIQAANAGCHLLPADPAMLDKLDTLLAAPEALARP